MPMAPVKSQAAEAVDGVAAMASSSPNPRNDDGLAIGEDIDLESRDLEVIEGMTPLVRSSTVTIDSSPIDPPPRPVAEEAQPTPAEQAVEPNHETTTTKDQDNDDAASTTSGSEGGSEGIRTGITTPPTARPATPASPAPDDLPRKRIVIVGLGMVAVSFIEKMLKLDAHRHEYTILVLGEEPHIAYNRVGLTSYFEHREAERLYLNPQSWYDDQHRLGKLNYMLSTTVAAIDHAARTVTTHSTLQVPATPIVTRYPVAPARPEDAPVVNTVPYDILVLATGSAALAPTATQGHDAPGVFLYRALGDLDGLITYSSQPHVKGSIGAVVGGGLLGLEAAKAMLDLANFGKVVIFDKNPWVLSRQLDEDAGRLVGEKIGELGVGLMSEKRVAVIKTGKGEGEAVEAPERVVGVRFVDGGEMDIGCICYAIGIKPRDELARAAGLDCSERGGILVNDELQTSAAGIYAIGECASWNKETYGLIAPGVEMADVLAFNLTQAKAHTPRTFKRPDLSTKLKLLGVDVASFGDYFADRDGPSPVASPRGRGAAAAQQVKALTYKDPFAAVYKKYIFTADGKRLLGGMMIGDTRDYIKLVAMVKNKKQLDAPPGEFILGSKKGDDGEDADELDDDTQVCSCHNVTKGDIVRVVKDGTCKSLGEVKSCTKAGTGCAGCIPLVQGIFNCEMKKLGQEISNHLCPHFAYSRIDLFNIITVKKYTTLPEVMAAVGKHPTSLGCEVCKPALASIFASLHNHHVLSTPHAHLQDTNDKYLGNIQRNGTFSVVPRVAGGEITPDKLIVIGNVAKRFGLYCKITGGQRIDMFGARKQDLVEIWTELVAAGMESGHAYAKSLRTIKSCVGTAWCRFGVGDSTGLAIRLENRYKSIRAPHKLKSAVSGCIRECAEAQNKDFGLIATDKGYNIYVGGNGGSKPRHGDLLLKDCPPDEVIPVLDRYLMFYIRTADKLQRTARWLEALPGGVKYLRDVILEDKLGIAASLEEQMSVLVATYFCEWTEVLNDRGKQERFRQFANVPDHKAAGALPVPVPPPSPPSSTEEEEEAPAGPIVTPVDLTDNGIEMILERGQLRPANWPLSTPTPSSTSTSPSPLDFKSLTFPSPLTYLPLAHTAQLPVSPSAPTASVALKHGDTQLALFHVLNRGFFATQQMCPHKRAFVLADGLVGDDPLKPGQLWVSCPQHKRNFEIAPPTPTTGEVGVDVDAPNAAAGGGCLTDPTMSIKLFRAEAREDGRVYVELPPVEELDAVLGTKRWMVRDGEGGEGQFGGLDRKLEEERGRRALKGRRGVKVGAGEGCGSPPLGKKEGGVAAPVVAIGGCGGGGVDW